MRQKIRCLRLEVVDAKGYRTTTTSIAMPKELPSIGSDDCFDEWDLSVVEANNLFRTVTGGH